MLEEELCLLTMIQFVLLFSRQGKLRLQKWFDAYQVKHIVWSRAFINAICQFKCPEKNLPKDPFQTVIFETISRFLELLNLGKSGLLALFPITFL